MYEIDLSNEVLNIDFSQGATKISVVKVGDRKQFLLTWLGSKPSCPGLAETADIYFTSNFDL